MPRVRGRRLAGSRPGSRGGSANTTRTTKGSVEPGAVYMGGCNTATVSGGNNEVTYPATR
eukprot:scaffold59213_cov36-Phaeocystis_antarctica.AAC.1